MIYLSIYAIPFKWQNQSLNCPIFFNREHWAQKLYEKMRDKTWTYTNYTEAIKLCNTISQAKFQATEILYRNAANQQSIQRVEEQRTINRDCSEQRPFTYWWKKD